MYILSVLIREWISVLTTINTSDNSIFNYCMFKRQRPKRYYLAFCGDKANFRMQKNNE